MFQDFHQIWNSSQTWIEFTECFQNTTLIFMPSIWLWSTVPIYLTYLIKARSQPLKGSWKGTVAQVCGVIVTFIQLYCYKNVQLYTNFVADLMIKLCVSIKD